MGKRKTYVTDSFSFSGLGKEIKGSDSKKMRMLRESMASKRGY